MVKEFAVSLRQIFASMKEKDEELFKRFKQFAIAIILFTKKLPKAPEY
jgi:hypothetical protein